MSGATVVGGIAEWHTVRYYVPHSTTATSGKRVMKAFTTPTFTLQNHSQHYFNKPPYAERHVRWCERTVREIIPYFLLDCFPCMHIMCGNSANHGRLRWAMQPYAQPRFLKAQAVSTLMLTYCDGACSENLNSARLIS